MIQRIEGNQESDEDNIRCVGYPKRLFFLRWIFCRSRKYFFFAEKLAGKIQQRENLRK
jgi:hypothetical protein